MYETIDSPPAADKSVSIQCLIFVPQNKEFFDSETGTSNSSNQEKIKGFVVLPFFVFENHKAIVQLFLRNSFVILDNQNCSRIQDIPIDILELVLEIDTDEDNLVPKTSPFPISVEEGHHKQVRELFNKDAGVYTYPDYYGIKLCRAINIKNIDSIESLFSMSSDVRYRNLMGETLLHFVARRTDAIFMKLLIKHGVVVDARSKDGSTPLHVAAETRDVNITSLLLQNGAAVNARKKDGATSLYIAIDNNCVEIARLLLKSGADPNIGKNNELTPLHVASYKKVTTIINDLLNNGANVNSSATYCHAKGMTPLSFAVENKDLETVKCFLKHGADVNIPCYDDQTILKLAVDLDCSNIVEEILKCNPDLHNKINNQALYSSMNGDKKNSDVIASMLSKYGFGVNFGFDNSSEFLHLAICEGYNSVVERLIKSGISVNRMYHYYDERSKKIQTSNPLFTAIRHNRNDIVKLLCDLGADVFIKFELESSVQTVFDFVEECFNQKALKILLMSNTSLGYSALFDEAWGCIISRMIRLTNNKDIIKKFILECAKVHGTDSLSDTLLNAAEDGHLLVLTELVNFGVYIDSRDEFGHTALHQLSLNKNCSEAVEFLIKNNADIEARCFTGQTPLIAAAKAGNSEVVMGLLKYGAKIDSVDNYGRSSLCYVVAEGHYKLFKALLDYYFTDRDFITRMNIRSLLNFSYHRSLKNEGNEAYLFERFTKHKDGFESCTGSLKMHLIEMNTIFSSEESVVRFVNENLKALASGEYICNSLDRLGFWLYEHEIKYCKEAAMCLKTRIVGDSDITFYDLLTKSEQQIIKYARNDSIAKIFDSIIVESRPSYRYEQILSYQIQKGTFRRRLLDQSANVCHLLVNQLNILPADLKEEVLNYLSNRDLEVLIHACSCISHSQTSLE